MSQLEPPGTSHHLIGKSSSFDAIMPPPTYAESLLYHKSFRFQSRQGSEKLDLRGISKVDIDKLVKEVDIELLQSFLENICFADVDEADFDLYSNDCFVKLFQVAQLTLEYLLHVQDSLSTNLNGLAKKYAGKKREIESLTTNLSKQDLEVARLRNEIYYNKEAVRRYEEKRVSDSTVGEIVRLDPSLFPSQERRSFPAIQPASNDANALTEETSSKPHTTQNAILLHVVSAADGKYFSFNVSPDISVADLMIRVATSIGISDVEHMDQLALFHRNKELKNPLKLLKDCDVVDGSALILMPAPQPQMQCPQEPGPSIEPALESSTMETPITYNIVADLEELTSVASKSQEELMIATRLLQDQVSFQNKHKDEFVNTIGEQMKTLEKSLQEEVQRRVHIAVMEQCHRHFSDQQVHRNTAEPDTSRLGDSMKASDLLSKLNIGELESVHSDEEEKNDEMPENDLDEESETTDQCDKTSANSDDDGASLEEKDGDVPTAQVNEVPQWDEKPFENEPFEQETINWSQMPQFPDEEVRPPIAADSGMIKFVEEPAEEEPFEQQILSGINMNPHQDDSMEEKEVDIADFERDSSFQLPGSYTVHPRSDIESPKPVLTNCDQITQLTPTPTKGILDRGEKLEHPMQESTDSEHENNEVIVPPESPWTKSAEDTLQEMQADAAQFRFTEFEEESKDQLDDLDTMKITPGRPMTADSDMQSVEVSHSDFLFNVNGELIAEANAMQPEAKCQKKKKSRFTWKGPGGKRFSMPMPKWRKTKGQFHV